MGTFWGFLYRQLTVKPKPLPANVSLRGKTVLVTGANVGLGLEACQELAAHGAARIILGVRSVSKGETAKSTILALSPNVDVQVWELDQESAKSIKAFADKAASLDRLDVVILNAGVKVMEFTKSKFGHESNIQVNHLGTALLSLLLCGPLRRTGAATGSPARLTIVSSENHFWVDLKEIKSDNALARMDDMAIFQKGMVRYNSTKLLNVLWMRELSARVRGNIIINAVNPGFCRSSLHRGDPGGSWSAKLLGRTAAQGGHCLTDAATQHERDGHGAYLSEQAVTDPSSFVLSAEGAVAQRKIWDETVQLLQKETPGIDLMGGIDA
ncbi:NAD(P)-binding protein [Xylaria intraflava]|nr:NAD(P)-binding protein [Xylaria intraflava]